MANRKQTPDVLGEILGGESQVPQVTPAPKPQAPPKRSRNARKSTRQSRAKRAGWEYMEVVFRDYGGYRPRYVNGQEEADWKQAPLIHEYLNQLGEEGWEVAGVGGRHNDEMPVYCKRPRK